MTGTGPAAAAPLSAIDPAKRRAPPRLLSLILCGLVMFVDGYDLAAMPLAVPHVTHAFGLPAADFAIALSAVLLGLGLGAVLLAPLGDRFGRRRVIVLGAIALGITTMGAATGATVVEFAIWRLINGMALGACLPNVTALTAEIASPDKRASTLTVVSLGISIGAIVSGLIVPPLVALAGWRAIFTIPGALTLLLAVALRLWLPADAPRRPAEESRDEDRPAPRKADIPLVRLLRPPLLWPALIFALLYGVNAFALYLVTSWLPTLLPQAGFAVDAAARYLSLQQFGGFLIGLILARLLDRGHAVKALAGTYALIAIAFALFSAVAPDPIGWGVLILIAGGGISGAHLAILAVATGFFPRDLLSTALGFGVAVARIGAIGGPLLGGHIIGAGMNVPAFFLIAALPALACLAMTLLIPIAQRHGQP